VTKQGGRPCGKNDFSGGGEVPYYGYVGGDTSYRRYHLYGYVYGYGYPRLYNYYRPHRSPSTATRPRSP
jgi:hypothetical protein